MLDNLKRDFTQNFARLADNASEEELRPLFLTEDVAAVTQTVERWAEKTPRWDLIQVSDSGDVTKIHLTHTTRWLRFTDDIHVKLARDEQDAKTRIDAESQSRVGKGDLGQNPRNLKALREGIQTASQP